MKINPYRFGPNLLLRLSCTAIAVGGVYHLLKHVGDLNTYLIWWVLLAVGAIALGVGSWLNITEITNDAIVGSIGAWKPTRGTMRWDEVKQISDEHFLFLHWFYIDNEIVKSSATNRTSCDNIFFTRYKDFLREVISHVRPSTDIAKSILKRIGFTQADIGKNYGKPLEPNPPVS